MSHELIISNFFMYINTFSSFHGHIREEKWTFFFLGLGLLPLQSRQTSPFFFFFCLFLITWCCCYFCWLLPFRQLLLLCESLNLFSFCQFNHTKLSSLLCCYLTRNLKSYFFSNMIFNHEWTRFIGLPKNHLNTLVCGKNKKNEIHLKCRSSILIPS